MLFKKDRHPLHGLGLEEQCREVTFKKYMDLIMFRPSEKVSGFVYRNELANIVSDLDENGNVRLKFWDNTVITADQMVVQEDDSRIIICKAEGNPTTSALKNIIGDTLTIGIKQGASERDVDIPEDIIRKKWYSSKKEWFAIESYGKTINVSVDDLYKLMFRKQKNIQFNVGDYRIPNLAVYPEVDRDDKSIRGILIHGCIYEDAEIIINGMRISYKIGPNDLISKLGTPRIDSFSRYDSEYCTKSERLITNFAARYGYTLKHDDYAMDVIFDTDTPGIILHMFIRR